MKFRPYFDVFPSCGIYTCPIGKGDFIMGVTIPNKLFDGIFIHFGIPTSVLLRLKGVFSEN